MPILSLVSNGGLTVYSNKLSKVITAYSNSGYSGRDPLFHATTAWVTAASSNANDFFFDAWLVGAGGGGSSGSPSGGITPGGGGGAGGYLYASGVQVGTSTGMALEVGMGRNTNDGKAGQRGGDTFISDAALYAYAGSGGMGGDTFGNPTDLGGRGPGTVGYYSVSRYGSGSAGGNSPSFRPGVTDYTPWQGGNQGGDVGYYGGSSYNSGGGGGMGGAGSTPPSTSPSTVGGAGGPGLTLDWPGYVGGISLGGGGGGASDKDSGQSSGGSGGGGAGGYDGVPTHPGLTSGVGKYGANASSWGAGGGGSMRPARGGRGGNGFIYIKYPTYFANSTFIDRGDDNDQRDSCVMEYSEPGGYRLFKFSPKVGAVTTNGKNYYYCGGTLYFPHRFNHVIDQASGLNGRPHRLNFRSAEQGGGATSLPIPTAFGPFSVNGWAISLNEDTATGQNDYFSWLTYPNNLSDFADIGTGDFMLQTYVKKTGYYGGTGRSQPVLYLEWASGNSIEFGNFYDPGGNCLGYSSTGTSGTPIVGSTAAADNTWYKFRVQRNTGVVSVFVDDVRVSTGADTTDYSGTPTKVWIGWNGYAYSWDVRAFVGQISGMLFKKGTTPVFDLRDSNNFRNKLNSQTVIPRNQNQAAGSSSNPMPEIVIGGSLDTYSTTNFPSSDKIHSIYWNGTATVNTSITWDGYFPNGIPNTSPTYVFTANTGDFCVDGWLYPTANTNDMVIYTHESDNYFSIRADVSSRRLKFDTSTGAGSTLYGPNGGLIANCWNHFAVQREGGLVKVFTNGVLGDSLTGSGAGTYNFSDATRRPSIGGRYDGGNRFTGYMTQLRYSRFARYSSTSYTVPTTIVSSDSASLFVNGYAGGGGGPPVWDATQKNQFISAGNPGTVTTSPVNSSTNSGAVRFSSTGQFYNQYNGNGSLYSDGNGHYFYFTGPKNQRNFKFGTKDFCVEGWWNADYVPSQKTLIDFRSSTSQIAFALKIDTSNRILFVVTNTTRITSAPITLGQSFHLAVERVGGVTTLYINGLRSGVTYSDTNDYIAVQDRPVIFTDGTSLTNESFVGNMQIMRVTKDYPRYSANFSPGPTAIFDTIGINQTYLPYI